MDYLDLIETIWFRSYEEILDEMENVEDED